jgi:hypothetical protein
MFIMINMLGGCVYYCSRLPSVGVFRMNQEAAQAQQAPHPPLFASPSIPLGTNTAGHPSRSVVPTLQGFDIVSVSRGPTRGAQVEHVNGNNFMATVAKGLHTLHFEVGLLSRVKCTSRALELYKATPSINPNIIKVSIG